MARNGLFDYFEKLYALFRTEDREVQEDDKVVECGR